MIDDIYDVNSHKYATLKITALIQYRLGRWANSSLKRAQWIVQKSLKSINHIHHIFVCCIYYTPKINQKNFKLNRCTRKRSQRMWHRKNIAVSLCLLWFLCIRINKYSIYVEKYQSLEWLDELWSLGLLICCECWWIVLVAKQHRIAWNVERRLRVRAWGERKGAGLKTWRLRSRIASSRAREKEREKERKRETERER